VRPRLRRSTARATKILEFEDAFLGREPDISPDQRAIDVLLIGLDHRSTGAVGRSGISLPMYVNSSYVLIAGIIRQMK